ncbi:isocitrate lyase/PEP mutase family protein [Acidiferrimicrobium sp. IK]|uniref:isocitrate lyase/PEP mutase family protein n=1 Tax=Acidiferrimicrobium sp. IK TaxID=2871700 RepID=UPI0021CB69ED|nr:isocitrate lyase/PEP mutase family protein [Acidiferrimicrobium sp. IK]MCU4185338.1 isocitrate lyase/PEP mutase family protein [Acidiferrimicrobium sp. IK]
MADLLRTRPGGPGTLRELLRRDEPLLAPGAYDALGARLIEAAGFEAVYMTGFGAAASLLGRPDVGLLGLSEMAGHAARLAAAVDVPLIADADTGYGNAVTVIRTVQEYERAGVAALHLEDQVQPKRCGHMAGKDVVAVGEMVAKLRAATDARSDPDLVLIARTDARAVEGLDAALDRARAYRDAGADMLFVEALEGVGEIERVAAELAGTPLLFNWVEGGRTPPLSLAELTAMGFALVIMPITTLLAATAAMRAVLAQVKADGTPQQAATDLPSFDDMVEAVGLGEISRLERRYTP